MTTDELNTGYTRALITTLDAIDEHEERRDGSAKEAGPFMVMSLKAAGDFYDQGQHYIEDPLGQALRAGIRDLGQVMATNITIDEMKTIAHIASASRNVDILDKGWDGVTDSHGTTWFA